MYQIKDSDLRSYNLRISNGVGEPLEVPLGVGKQPDNAHRLELGLGLGLTLGPVVLVLTIIGAVCWRTRRGQGQAEAPEDLKYDSLSQENLGRPYTYREPSLDADQRGQAVSMRDESDHYTSSKGNRMSKDQGARKSVVKTQQLYASVARPTRDRNDEAYSNADNEAEIGVCVDNIYNNSC
ncbi:unnamed protein product [Lymnaea stagnalis]|uniref:Uncharacterized protein n=1 Tax=Lymnaea stagnalis TaxID=6523 RepID=A0AAV2IA54_LYMST